ncbi:MAG: HAD-IC family P-type ATPase [Gammaproteobacteria bacterium]|nr:HAD-IC family P-type ATPase [Gammaproteobacteria bacterium]
MSKPSMQTGPEKLITVYPHALNKEQILSRLTARVTGLTHEEVLLRQQKYGPNALPRKRPPGLFEVFLNQFKSPLIYVLVAAALVSLLIREFSDAIFISAVLFLNAIIGTVQEFSAQRSADALQKMMMTRVRVLREGDAYEINSEEIVPGDIVLLESGERVPADMRLLESHNLEIDESLLSGESFAVIKQAETVLENDAVLGDRINMAFAGSLVNRGRATCVVVSIGLATELGMIAKSVTGDTSAKAPLQVRMERFTQRVAIFVGCAVLAMATILLVRGMPVSEIFLSSVALAVSVIPEGLPVALTVALAIGMRRMARRDVIVRRLIAVEALGSCTYIASDKTGTLTANQLTVRRLAFADNQTWEVNGESDQPNGEIVTSSGEPNEQDRNLLNMACQCAILANEGYLGHQNGDWTSNGDAVDVALLIMAHRENWVRAEVISNCPEIDTIPFESERLYSASLNWVDGRPRAFVKGAFEKLLLMCDQQMSRDGIGELDKVAVEAQARQLASQGYRVIALASGDVEIQTGDEFVHRHLQNLTLIGLVGLIDPLRPEAKAAVAKCRDAGIQVAMVTGDHPVTALAIGRELNLLDDESQVITGSQLKAAANEAEVDRMTRTASVFARVEPTQKLDIVQSLQRNGHYVAVSGDGANDAPALRAAQVGVAMGKNGTDVARETAAIIITDDNFDSIVDGVEEGRIAYANVRKVIFLLVSTGAAELVLFVLAMITALPLPLLAVQLLWLNLVTNGIQDIALAFEPGEGGELKQPPRSPKEAIFNRIMLERVIISAVVIGVVAFGLFIYLLDLGFNLEQARNSTLLLMVLFENVHVFNSRSESLSVFRHNPLRNKLLLGGTCIAQLVHIGAMYTPWLGDVLGASPVTFEQWLSLLGLALSVLVVMELHKWFRSRFTAVSEGPGTAGGKSGTI